MKIGLIELLEQQVRDLKKENGILKQRIGIKTTKAQKQAASIEAQRKRIEKLMSPLNKFLKV